MVTVGGGSDTESDTNSVCSASMRSGGAAWFGGRDVVKCRLEEIRAQFASPSQYIPVSTSSQTLFDAYQRYREQKHSNSSGSNNGIATDHSDLFRLPTTVPLSEEDRKLGHLNDDDDDNDVNDVDGEVKEEESISAQFDKYYGTSIDASGGLEKPIEPYLSFDAPSAEVQASLNRLLASAMGRELGAKSSLAVDIEKQLTVAPLRVSRRQRKKERGAARQKTLPGWFDMPKVTEISKEQAKDLEALRMRRVWDAKQFYKKSTAKQLSSEYFQVGTVVETAADFYSGRIPKRDRKRTIVDELMADAQLKAFNKRKMAKMMAQGGRLRQILLRNKLKKQKLKIKRKREEKVHKGQPQQFNVFTTYDL